MSVSKVFIQSNISGYDLADMPQTVASGTAYHNTGDKAIAFNWDYNTKSVRPTPVLYNVYSGYASGRNSVQKGGNIILHLDWGRNHETQSINVYGLPDVTDAAIVAALQRFFDENQEYASWFGIQPRGASYLPNSEKNAAQIAKEKKIADLKTRFGVELPLSAENSPKAGLQFDPKPMPEGWEEWMNSYRGHSGSLVGIDNGNVWYFSNGKGKAKQIADWAINGSHGSNYAHTDTEYFYGGTLGEYLQMNRPPMWAKYLVKVEYGAYTRDHHSYGCKLEIFTLPNAF